MSNLLGVIVWGMLIYVVVCVLVFGLKNHIENYELKEEIGKRERDNAIKEAELEFKIYYCEKTLKYYVHKNYRHKDRIRELEQQLKEQSNPIDNRINWIKEQLEQKSNMIDKYNKEYRELLDELDRAQNQK